MVETLRRSGLEVDLRVLAEGDDPGRLASAAAAAGRDVVVAGGDGTVRPAATALVASAVTLGIVPLGSWNNIARGCGIPQDPAAALALVAAGATRDGGRRPGLAPGGGRCGCRGRCPRRRDCLLRGGRRGTGRRGLRGSQARRAARNLERAAPRLAGAASPSHPDAAPGRWPATAHRSSGRDRLQRPVSRVGLRGRARRGSGRRVAGRRRLLRHEPRRRHPALPGGGAWPATARTADALPHRATGSRGKRQQPLPAHADGEPLGATPIAFTVRPFALRIFALPGEAPPGT